MKVIFEVEEKQAAAMALFFKSCTYEDAYRRSQGETEEARKIMAYTMLNGFTKVKRSLEKFLEDRPCNLPPTGRVCVFGG